MADHTDPSEPDPTWLGPADLLTARAPSGATTTERVAEIEPDVPVNWLLPSSKALLPPLTAWQLWRRRHPVALVAPEGERRLNTSRVTVEGLRWLAFRIASTAWIGLGWLLQTLFGRPRSNRSPAIDRSLPDGFVLPVLPDLSHTFVYRELLAILAKRPATRVFSLRSDPDAPVHDEAATLLGAAERFPPGGVRRMYWSLTCAFLRSPRRVGQVFALHHRAEDSSIRQLLDKTALTDPAHPGRAFALAAWLRRHPVRHLHVYGSTYPTNSIMNAAILLGRPFSVSSYVDFDFRYDHRMLADKFGLAAFFRVENHACHRSFVERVPAARKLTTPQRDPEVDRVPVIYYGLNLDLWQDRATPAGAGRLVSASRLVEKKGLHLMPEALRRLRDRGVECRWILFGDGPMRGPIARALARHQVEDLVELRGAQPNQVVREQLLSADLAVLPCLVAKDGERDGIPNFLTEAMALEVPVVTTPVSGIPEIIRDGESGFLATPDDVESLVDTIARALHDADLRARVATGGRTEVVKARDCVRNAKALLQHIDRSTHPNFA